MTRQIGKGVPMSGNRKISAQGVLKVYTDSESAVKAGLTESYLCPCSTNICIEIGTGVSE